MVTLRRTVFRAGLDLDGIRTLPVWRNCHGPLFQLNDFVVALLFLIWLLSFLLLSFPAELTWYFSSRHFFLCIIGRTDAKVYNQVVFWEQYHEERLVHRLHNSSKCRTRGWFSPLQATESPVKAMRIQHIIIVSFMMTRYIN